MLAITFPTWKFSHEDVKGTFCSETTITYTRIED